MWHKKGIKVGIKTQSIPLVAVNLVINIESTEIKIALYLLTIMLNLLD